MKNYKSTSISIINKKEINKPNEDYYLCDDNEGIYIIVDGVSRDKINGIYPNPSPSEDVSKIFVESVYKYFLQSLYKKDKKLLLYEMINYGNEEIKKYNDKIKWENNFIPGTVGIIVIMEYDKMHYAYIGDCVGSIINKNKEIFTKCQTKKIIQNKEKFSSMEIRNEICNNKNHPYSYGVLNGDKRALNFVEYGVVKIFEKDKIFLCSDGFSDVIYDIPATSIYSMNMDEIEACSKDKDDKTLIIIERNSKERITDR